MKKVLQIKITLRGLKPLIWRRILVTDMSFAELGQVIKAVMEWDGGHLSEFQVPGVGTVCTPSMFDDEFDEGEDGTELMIGDYLKKKGDKVLYVYDFGDDWNHIVTLEKVLPKEEGRHYPVCIGGKRNSPLEDSGGLWGYEELLLIAKDKTHPEYEEKFGWREDFDSEYFDMDSINNVLKNY